HFLGDGVLAVFGTLQAHEDDPERAIRAAMEIREAAQRLGLDVTAGINTGEVYVGAIGSEKHQEMTVVGPVVNLASRLQGQAEPGRSVPTPNTQHPTLLFLEGRCLELGMSASYSVFIDLFCHYFAWTPEGEERARGERLDACLRELIQQGELTAEHAAEIGPL